MDWNNARTGKTIREANLILDLSSGKEDERIWIKFNQYIDNDIVSDYFAEFCSILCESKTPMRESLFTMLLPEKVPNRKQETSRFLITMYLSHGESEKALEAIANYKKEYGSTKEVLVEELEYYNSFDTENTAKIEELIEAIQNFEAV